MLPLIPLISLAGTLVPEIIGLFGGRRAGEVAGKVAEVVQTVAGTSDPQQAEQAIRDNAAKQEELRLRLEEIKRQFVALELEDRQKEREALLASLRLEMEDRGRASGMLGNALGAQGWAATVVALAPVVVSAGVLAGFVWFSAELLTNANQLVDERNEFAKTLVNVIVGALVAAFTAVINFWLGSSQGSRDKDRTVVALQEAQARQASESVRQVQQASTAALDRFASVAATPAPLAAPAPTPAAGAPAAAPVPGMPTRFDLCLEAVIGREGGFSDHPADRGGATMLGITQATLAAWRHRPVTVEEVKALQREEACEIYRANYWNSMKCDEMPKGVDLMVFHFGVNAGPPTAVKLLQRIVGVKPDGAVGQFTLGAVRRSEPRGLIEELARRQLEFYASLDNAAVFGKGWENRVAELRRQALLMATG